MVDIASLAIKIDTSDVAKGEQALDKLAAKGAKAEAAADGVARAFDDAAGKVGAVGTASAGAASSADKLSEAAKRQAAFVKQAGISAGQYQQAMRMLPMQLTDVATSLASGMPAWMVAIQQGGQVRDSFGGIGNAAKAVVSTINPVALAIGGVAAAAGALLIAFEQGRAEARAYSQALILTGNASGTSANALAGMAEAIDQVAGTQRNAAAVLAEVAGTGKFAAEQIQGIATAAIVMEQATGRAVSDTVKEFARLADEPAAASAKLNEQYNYLTASVYRQIRALEDSGRATEAAKLATETYAQAVQERAAAIDANLGTLERGWLGVKAAAAEAWDAMLDIGRAGTLEDQLSEAQAALERNRNLRFRSFDDDYQATEYEQKIAYLQAQLKKEQGAATEGEDAAVTQAGIAASRALDSGLKSNASNAQKLAAELKQIDANAAAAAKAGIAYTSEQIESLKAAAREQYKEAEPQSERYLDNLRRQADLHGVASEAARVRYDIERGDLGELTAEQQKSLISAAEELDAKRASTEAAKEAEAAAKRQGQQLEQLRAQQENYVAGLEKQAATLGLSAVEARQYEVAERGLTGALRERAEASIAAIAAAEKQRDYQALVKELRTDEEALTDQLRERVAVLDAAKVSADEYADAITRATRQAIDEAPKFGGLDASVSGAAGELVRVAEAEAELQKWYQTQLDEQRAFLDEKLVNEETYAARVQEINQQNSERLGEIQAAYKAATLGVFAEVTGQAADMLKGLGDDGSAAYKALFLANKAASIAMAIVNTEEAATKALAIDPTGLMSAITRAAGYASVGIMAGTTIAGMAHDGIDNIPREGTWLLDKGERVVDRRTNGDLKQFLSQQSQPAASGPIQITVHQPGVTNAREARESSAAAARRISRAVHGAGRYS